MRNLIVAKLKYELSILSKRLQVALIPVYRFRRLERNIASRTEQVVESHVGPPQKDAIPHVTVFIEFRTLQRRGEWQVWSAVHIARGKPHTEVDVAVASLFVLGLWFLLSLCCIFVLALVLSKRGCRQGQRKKYRESQNSTPTAHRPFLLPIARTPSPTESSIHVWRNDSSCNLG